MKEGKAITDEFWDEAVERAREEGKEHAPGHICGRCTRLDLQPWQDERLKEIAGWRIDEDYKPFFRQPPEPPTDEHVHLHNEVFEAFREAFHEHAADPERCDVCLDEGLECGHERQGEDCPA